jgi:hypothetical protein
MANGPKISKKNIVGNEMSIEGFEKFWEFRRPHTCARLCVYVCVRACPGKT